MNSWLYLETWILVISEDPWRKRHTQRGSSLFPRYRLLENIFLFSVYSRHNNVDKETVCGEVAGQEEGKEMQSGGSCRLSNLGKAAAGVTRI